MNRVILAIAGSLAVTCEAAPSESLGVCYVRTEAFVASSAENTEARGAHSYVGVRRKSEKLFELDISIAGQGNATCSVNGVARLRGEPGQEMLGMVVRPDPTRKTARTGTLCQVFVRLTPVALEVRTTPSSCQAQSLCEGRVELNGQRFEQATKLPDGTKWPCFERRAP